MFWRAHVDTSTSDVRNAPSFPNRTLEKGTRRYIRVDGKISTCVGATGLSSLAVLGPLEFPLTQDDEEDPAHPANDDDDSERSLDALEQHSDALFPSSGRATTSPPMTRSPVRRKQLGRLKGSSSSSSQSVGLSLALALADRKSAAHLIVRIACEIVRELTHSAESCATLVDSHILLYVLQVSTTTFKRDRRVSRVVAASLRRIALGLGQLPAAADRAQSLTSQGCLVALELALVSADLEQKSAAAHALAGLCQHADVSGLLREPDVLRELARTPAYSFF